MKLATELQEGVRIAAGAILANLLRSVLTTIGIIIGIVTVSLMATALEGLNRSFSDAVSFMGTDVLYVDQREWFISNDQQWQAAGKRRKITLPQVHALERELGQVAGIAPTAMSFIDGVQHGDRRSGSVNIIGTNDQFLITGGVTLAAGRFMTKAEAEGNRDVCIVGSEIADNLFLHESPLGQRLRAGKQTLEVIGVLEKRGSVFGQMSLDNQLILPLGKMIRGFRWDPTWTVQIKVGDATRVPSVREEVRGLMRKIRHVPPGAVDDFAINQQEQLMAQFGKVSAIIATAGFFITGLSLCVGGIGIMNIMFVSVAERTREIGLRKAIGARRRTILLQFLLEAASICLLGGVLALCLAGAAVLIARHWLPNLALSLPVILLALSVALATGVIAGFLPAWRASRLSPVEALRSE